MIQLWYCMVFFIDFKLKIDHIAKLGIGFLSRCKKYYYYSHMHACSSFHDVLIIEFILY
jgi:hypothetical protein